MGTRSKRDYSARIWQLILNFVSRKYLKHINYLRLILQQLRFISKYERHKKISAFIAPHILVTFKGSGDSHRFYDADSCKVSQEYAGGEYRAE